MSEIRYDVWLPDERGGGDPDDAWAGAYEDLEEAIALCESVMDERLLPLLDAGLDDAAIERALVGSRTLPFVSAPMDPEGAALFDAIAYARMRLAGLRRGG